MSVRIVIECEDYWVAHSLNAIAAKIEKTDILKTVYNKSKTAKSKGTHYKATIEHIK